MYVITGATGNTGSVAAETLLARGEKVRVIGRAPDRLERFTKKGAEAAIVDIADPDPSELTKAFSGATSVYVMIPPDPRSSDILSYEAIVTKAIVSAVQTAAVSHVVALSSVGADKPDRTGPVLGLMRLEEELSRVAGLNALFIRAGYFMENTLPQVSVIKNFGMMAGPLRPDLKLPMIATRDIGEYAAQAMLKRDFQGKQSRELLGQRDLSYEEVARVIGATIGNTGLSYRQMPAMQLKPALMAMGMSGNFVDLLMQMSEALNTGYMIALEPRTPENTTPTTIERFVTENFVPAYRGTARAAS